MSDTSLQAVENAPTVVGQAIDKARAGEDRELAGRVRSLGEALANTLSGLIRLTRLHDLGNDAFRQPLDLLSRQLAELADLLGAVHIVLVEENVYINDVRIRFESRAESGALMGAVFRRHRVGGISFHQVPDPEGVFTFVKLVTAPPPPDAHAREALEAALRAANLEFIDLQPIFRFRVTNEAVAEKEVREVAARSSRVVSEAWVNLAASRAPNPLPLRRLVTDLIDIASEGRQDALLLIGTERDDPPHVLHSVQVAALSILIGRAVGLSEASLSDLGTAAVLHDVGYTVYEDGHPPPFERHAAATGRSLLRQRGFHQAKIRRLLVAWQHHWRHDDPRQPHLYSRIVHIADDYDNFTRSRPGGPLHDPPDALANMIAAAGSEYDPVLIQAFANAVGRYPPGTLLEFRDGSWGVVISGARGPERFARPLCRVVVLPDGTRPEAEILLDLAVREQAQPFRVKRSRRTEA